MARIDVASTVTSLWRIVLPFSLMASSMIGLRPVLLVYICLQRSLVQGIALTGITG